MRTSKNVCGGCNKTQCMCDWSAIEMAYSDQCPHGEVIGKIEIGHSYDETSYLFIYEDGTGMCGEHYVEYEPYHGRNHMTAPEVQDFLGKEIAKFAKFLT